jgi:CRISPR system Cascade subunit CasB
MTMADQAKQVYAFTKQKITGLFARVQESGGKVALANLRRGIGKAPGELPELWPLTLEGLPKDLQSRNGEPTWGEWAAHAALTLYALHQQGEQTRCASGADISLGKALHRLCQKADNPEQKQKAVKRRFDAAATAESFGELTHHLRGLVQLLKQETEPLDYPRLAGEMYQFFLPETQESSDAWNRVRLRWGQDFYAPLTNNEQSEENAS